MRSRSITPPFTAADLACTFGIQRDPIAASAIAGINGIASAANVRAWPRLSINTPAISGPLKFADAYPRLSRLKLRARPSGPVIAPTSVCIDN